MKAKKEETVRSAYKRYNAQFNMQFLYQTVAKNRLNSYQVQVAFYIHSPCDLGIDSPPTLTYKIHLKI
jgi:hypothetical protein